MSTYNVSDVMQQVLDGVISITKIQGPKIKYLIRSQFRAAAEYGEIIVEGINKKEIHPSELTSYAEQLEDMIVGGVYVIAGSAIALIEAIWNKVVSIIWSAISVAFNAALNVVFPMPDFEVE